MPTRPLLLIALAALLSGCGKPAVSFNNQLAALEKKTETPTKTLKAHFDGYWNTKKFDPAKADADYDALLTSIDQVITDAKAVKPPNINLAREFQEAFITFYTEQRDLVTTEIRQALDLLKNESMPEKEKEAKLQALEAAMSAKAVASTNKMQAVQHRFAAANQMQMEPGK